MSTNLIQVVSKNPLLTPQQVEDTLHRGLEGKFARQKVLVLIPDHTRTLPLPMLFRQLVDILNNAQKLDFMVALGTHPSLSKAELNKLVMITDEERTEKFMGVRLLNHEWDSPTALKKIGVISKNQVQEIAGAKWHPSMNGDVPVLINRRIFEYDQVVILGPTFPHEVVGFSGGAKYLFPGISGPDMINATHWLGALTGVMGTIGLKDTSIRRMIHQATSLLNVPLTLIALTVVGESLSSNGGSSEQKQPGLAGIFIGDIYNAWSAAADLSSEVHVQWCEKPFQKVLSRAPEMYNELWTAAKAMYKLESVVADGGELIIYAPHLDVVSFVHGKYIFEVGYHILPYFLDQWDKFKHIPLGVLAHSTHVRGGGEFIDGKELPRINVTLASKISKEDCERLSLGYLDPAEIKVSDWQNREDEGVLYVPKAGEILYRLRS